MLNADDPILPLLDPASVYGGFTEELGQSPIVAGPVVVEPYEDGRLTLAAADAEGRIVLAVVSIEVDDQDRPQRHVSFVYLTASTMLALMELVPNRPLADISDEGVIGRILPTDTDPEG